MFRKAKIGLALGGGGARGLAHIGVLKVFERESIPIDIIVGTSIGAVIGGMYAIHPDSQMLEKKFRDFLSSDQYRHSGLELFKKKKDAENFFGQVATYVKERVVINLAHSRASLTNQRRLTEALEIMLEDKNIEDARIKFAATTVDLVSGEGLVLTKGSIKKAIAASSSIPGFLPPLNYDGQLLVDGCVVYPVPVKPTQDLGARVVIAVDVSQELEAEAELDNVIDILFRTNSITAQKYRILLLDQADVILRPKVGTYHWSEFKLLDKMITEGERAAEAALPHIRTVITRRYQLLKKFL